jgi:DNA-binding MarR family transcriptional regulator
LTDERQKGGDAFLSGGDTLKALNQQLGDPSLKSSTRVLILIMLAMNRRMTANELRSMTGCGKGSLMNHLEKLETAGYVRIRTIKSFSGSGRRQVVEVTEGGREECRTLLQKIRGLDV